MRSEKRCGFYVHKESTRVGSGSAGSYAFFSEGGFLLKKMVFIFEFLNF